MNVHVSITEAELKFKELESKLSTEKVQKAAKMAINDSVRWGKTRVKNAIKEKYNFTNAALNDTSAKKGLSIQLANNKSEPEGLILTGHTPRTLHSFKGTKVFRTVKGSTISYKTRKGKVVGVKRGKNIRGTGGVSVEVLAGDRKVVPSAFALFVTKGKKGSFSKPLDGNSKMVPFGRGNHDGVRFSFAQPRYPIAALKGVSIATAARNQQVQTRYGSQIGQRYTQRYQHHLTRLIASL